jgi:hypothetical protein
MKIKNWIACIQDQGKWKEVIEKAKTFKQEAPDDGREGTQNMLSCK